MNALVIVVYGVSMYTFGYFLGYVAAYFASSALTYLADLLNESTYVSDGEGGCACGICTGPPDTV